MGDDHIEETLILGPGMSVSRFASGEVVFTIEDEDGHRVAANASTFDSNHWVLELRGLLARCQGKAIQPKQQWKGRFDDVPLKRGGR